MVLAESETKRERKHFPSCQEKDVQQHRGRRPEEQPAALPEQNPRAVILALALSISISRRGCWRRRRRRTSTRRSRRCRGNGGSAARLCADPPRVAQRLVPEEPRVSGVVRLRVGEERGVRRAG